MRHRYAVAVFSKKITALAVSSASRYRIPWSGRFHCRLEFLLFSLFYTGEIPGGEDAGMLTLIGAQSEVYLCDVDRSSFEFVCAKAIDARSDYMGILKRYSVSIKSPPP